MDMMEWPLPPAKAEGRQPGPGRPMVHVSYAQSLDGRIATSSGDSRGISSAESLVLTHRIRAESAAILVGVGTVLADDPQLTCRLPVQVPATPVRVVLDTDLRIPLESQLVRTAGTYPTLVYCAEKPVDRAFQDRRALLGEAGVSVTTVPRNPQLRLDLELVLADLGMRGSDLVFVEGGQATLTAFVAADLVDLYTIFLSPRFLGSGIEAIGQLETQSIAHARQLQGLWIRAAGPDQVWRLRPF